MGLDNWENLALSMVPVTGVVDGPALQSTFEESEERATLCLFASSPPAMVATRIPQSQF